MSEKQTRKKKKMNVGLGFVTGRKSFKKVVKSYIDRWNESDMLTLDNVSLSLFVAYDLGYSKTKASDYTISNEEILDSVDSAHYFGEAAIEKEIDYLVRKKIISRKDANLVFGQGYGMKRNLVLYFALKNKMDALIFLDDDEYPIAVIDVENSMAWKGQEVIPIHIKNLIKADMTHGHHCGYISPIPKIKFNETLGENDFRLYIEAVSNDIITWGSVKEKMDNGGITYADLKIINNKEVKYVKEVDGMKFISGANLGFNLKNIDKIFPFYNPPNARGEDAFLSTSIGDCKVRKIPCYTFHDGFGLYENLLSGVLPNKLQEIHGDEGDITERFLQASIGWLRYKPLLLYIANKKEFNKNITKIREDLELVIPKISSYFNNKDFADMIPEFDFYCKHVKKHYNDFQKTKEAWVKIVSAL